MSLIVSTYRITPFSKRVARNFKAKCTNSINRFLCLIKPVAFVPNSPTLIGNLGNDHSETVAAVKSPGESLVGEIDAIVVMTPHFQTYDSFRLVSS